jgi:hypothetical protein
VMLGTKLKQHHYKSIRGEHRYGVPFKVPRDLAWSYAPTVVSLTSWVTSIPLGALIKLNSAKALPSVTAATHH